MELFSFSKEGNSTIYTENKKRITRTEDYTLAQLIPYPLHSLANISFFHHQRQKQLYHQLPSYTLSYSLPRQDFLHS